MTILYGVNTRLRSRGPNPAKKDRNARGWWPWAKRSVTGVTVNDETANSIVTFFRGVNLIATTIASFPVHIFEEVEEGQDRKIVDPNHYYLRRKPNPEQTHQELWTSIVADIVRGNAYLWVEKSGPFPVALWRIDRHRIQVGRRADGMKVYVLDGEVAMYDYALGGEVVHLRNWGDGLVGYDLVEVAQEAIALGISAQEYAARFFSQNGVPEGMISTEAVINPDQAQEIADMWNDQGGGPENWLKARVLGHGAKFIAMAVDHEKMQLESLRKFQAGEMATLLGVPPHMLGLVDRQTSWGTGILELTSGFQKFTLTNPVKLIEQAIDDSLLNREITNLYCKLNMDSMLRGTTLERYQAHSLGYGRWKSANEIRDDEGLPPVDGGDEVFGQVNLVPIGELGLQNRGNQTG